MRRITTVPLVTLVLAATAPYAAAGGFDPHGKPPGA